jgi:YVTN family beta-propeller protein
VPDLPSGTVTFLFTDIEGSTRLVKELRERYAELLADHQRLLREAFEEAGGQEIDTQGDAFFVAFRRAKDAVQASLAAQRAIAAHPWPDGAEVKVRMGMHTAEPAVGVDRYVGLGVHRAARICSAGHGGQILLSNATRELVEDELPPGVAVRDLGQRQLKDLDRPEHLFQLLGDGIAAEFPPLKTIAAQPEEATPFSGREQQLAAAVHAAVRPRRPRRRWLLLAAGAAVAAAAVAALLLSGGSAKTLAAVPPNSVGVIDPNSNEIVDAIEVGDSPGPIEASGSRVFVGNRNSQTVSQLSISQRKEVDTFGTGGRLSDLAVESGAVWVSDSFLGVIAAFAPQEAGRTRFSIAEGDFAFGAGTALARAGDDLWVANARPPSIGRIDLQGSELVSGVAQRIGLEHVPSALAADPEYVWVGSADGTVSRIDPVSGEVEAVEVGESVRAIAVGAGAVWVATAAGKLMRVERHLGVTASADVGKSPVAVAVGASAVWVANSGDGTVSKVDPDETRTIATILVGNRPQGVAVAGGLVWVSVRR